MFALAVDAGVGGKDLRSGASSSIMVFSTNATGSLTFPYLCSVPIALAIEALRHYAIPNDKLSHGVLHHGAGPLQPRC
jgi:hypothetical protein